MAAIVYFTKRINILQKSDKTTKLLIRIRQSVPTLISTVSPNYLQKVNVQINKLDSIVVRPITVTE